VVAAPGWPGMAPRWTSSDKAGVGTALSAHSSVWFTLSHGILNEIYYPQVDRACTRDCGLIVTDGKAGGFFAEEKRDTISKVSRLHDGVPAFRLENTNRAGRFKIIKQVLADPRHDVVLQKVEFLPLDDTAFRLFVLLAPRLVNAGAHNTAWLGDYKGQPMLYAEGSGTSLALGCSAPWLARSVGYVGTSDGWQDLRQNGELSWSYVRAPDGNVALVAEVDLSSARPFVLAVGFGRTWSEASFHVRASLERGFDTVEQVYTANWTAWQAPLARLDPAPAHRPRGHNLYRVSTATLRSHNSHVAGGMIASLSIPWGASKGDDDLGGYHLVWPRDLVQTAGGLIAAGARDDARLVLDYLRAIQEADGRWPQNCWLDGLAYWHGIQMDECAFPILLVDQARAHGMISEQELMDFWPMIRKAAGFIVRNGPATDQDRWEEEAGYSPYTLAIEVAALLAGAELASLQGEERIAEFLRDTADAWNADIETWTYASDTAWAKEAGVEGYYVRIGPKAGELAAGGVHGKITIRNRLPHDSDVVAEALISTDALALVRFGLRAADDPRIISTVKMIDRFLKVELPQGPGWRRYNRDGYGEHINGDPFDGVGEGRVWPLLIGERAHYELARGDEAEARRLLTVIEACTSDGGMLPEQVWDAEDIPERELFRGRPSGSAMPLAWAHAEYITLLHSLAEGAVFDMPALTVQRYQREGQQPRLRDWREAWRRTSLPSGQALRIELTAAAIVLWTVDDWSAHQEIATIDIGLGLHTVELPVQGLPRGRRIEFTWRRQDDGRWRGENYPVAVV
jgi:glucoamylase